MYFWFLLLICAGAGVLMIAGGIWLIYHEKIFLDSTTSMPVFVEVPFVGKLRTNAPSLALFVLGLLAVGYPIHAARIPSLTVKQQISSQVHPVSVYAVVRSVPLQNDGYVYIALPVLPEEYEPQLIYVAGTITNQETIDPSAGKNGILELKPRQIQYSGSPTPAIKSDVVGKPAGY